MQTSRGIEVPEDAIAWSFARSTGAGGQNVNKVSSKATLSVSTAALLGSPTKLARVIEALGETITVTCQESRSQWRNRQSCVQKLSEMIDAAAAPPAPPRRKTKPSKGAVERRLAGKKKDGEKKLGDAAIGKPDTVNAMPSRFTLKTMNALHKSLLAVSFGKFGWDAGKMPVLKLTTTGRKTGQKRTIMLTSPIQLGETWVIVASKGGDDDHPAWFLNLQADPTVEVDIRGKKSVRTARLATPEERSTMWPQITSVYTGYAGYQERTQREIPLVLLEPQA